MGALGSGLGSLLPQLPWLGRLLKAQMGWGSCRICRSCEQGTWDPEAKMVSSWCHLGS